MTPTDNGNITQFPNRIEQPILNFSRLYQEFTESGVDATAYQEDGEEIEQKHFSCPAYAQRAFSMYYLIYWCAIIGYDYTMVKFEYEGNELNEIQFFEVCKCKFQEAEHAEMENNLIQLCAAAMHIGFLNESHEQIANQLGIQEGFATIKSVFSHDLLKNILGIANDKEET